MSRLSEIYLAKLREDYAEGERFYASDMNEVTHTINVHSDDIVDHEERITTLEETGGDTPLDNSDIDEACK